MNDGLLGLYVLFSVSLLILFRWAHRCWGKAIMTTVFAPLVIVPMAFVAYMGIGVVLRGINSILDYANWDVSRSAISVAAGVLTTALLLILLAYYCRDQRHVATVESGPWLGVRYRAPAPRINQKRRLR